MTYTFCLQTRECFCQDLEQTLTSIYLYIEAQTLPRLLWPSDALEQERNNSVNRSIVPDCQGDIGLPLLNGGNKDYVWSAGEPLGHLLVPPCPKSMGNYNSLIQAG